MVLERDGRSSGFLKAESEGGGARGPRGPLLPVGPEKGVALWREALMEKSKPPRWESCSQASQALP